MKLYNTMSRRLEEFAPSGAEVKIYVCGITPYDHAHLGHAMSYIIFDVLRRYLEFRGYRVKHVQNYTDIDDRIIARANSLGHSFDQVAATYIDEFDQEMRDLNITPAHIFPRATQEIPTIVEMTERLIAASLAAAEESARPIQYLPSAQTRKEDLARDIAQRDGIQEGLICVLTCVEPCKTYEIHRNRQEKLLQLRLRLRKCKFLYHYWIDPQFGFMSARIQTWFPFSIQVCMNGRDLSSPGARSHRGLRQPLHAPGAGIQPFLRALRPVRRGHGADRAGRHD